MISKVISKLLLSDGSYKSSWRMQPGALHLFSDDHQRHVKNQIIPDNPQNVLNAQLST